MGNNKFSPRALSETIGRIKEFKAQNRSLFRPNGLEIVQTCIQARKAVTAFLRMKVKK